MQKQMSIIMLIMVFCFMVIIGCKSNLSYKVSVYDTSDEKVKEEYEKFHPPSQGAVTVISRYYDLKELEASVEQYKDNLIALNALVPLVIAHSVPEPNLPEPNEDKINNVSECPKTVTKIIEEAFLPLRTALNDEIKRLDDILKTGGQLYIAPKPRCDFKALWNDTLLRLHEDRQVVVDPQRVQTTIKQLLPLVQNSEELTKIADRVARTEAGVDQSKTEAILEEFRKSSTRPDQVLKRFIEGPNEQVKEAVGRLMQTGPSRIQHLHIVKQNMSDPFMQYIAKHPENWKDVPNTAHVCGDGDADFILVFDDTMDARWKTIQLDPTAVIQARLRVSRVAAKAVAAIAGSLAASYGIPVPAATTGKSEKESIDFSVMTAEMEYLRQMNDYLAKRLESLKNFALENVGHVDVNDVNEVSGQLRRRLSELKIQPEKTK
jgi:hypothetical protein